MALRTDPDDVDGKAFHLKATWHLLERRENTEIVLIDVGDCFALGANKVVMDSVVQLNAHGAVMHAELFEDTFLDEEVDVFVDGCERDCGHPFLDTRVDLFWARVARHRLHHLIEDLALMRCGDTVGRTQCAKGIDLPGWGRRHKIIRR